MVEWRKIKGTKAWVSTTGIVKYSSIKVGGYTIKNVKRKPYRAENGRLYYIFYVNGKRKKRYVHLIVAVAFLPNPQKLRFVRHKDDDYTNNDVDNLEWAVRPIGVIPQARRGRVLNIRDVTKIRKQINSDDSLTDIANHWGVSISLISLIKSGHRWS